MTRKLLTAGRLTGVQALLLLLVPVVAGMFVGPYWVSELTLVGMYSLVIIGLNLFMGYAGQVSLGQAGFFGIGAYTVGILSTHFSLSPWLGLLAGAVLAAAVAWLLGAMTLHLMEHYLALATLAFGIIADVAFQQLPLTGGNSGLYGIGSFALPSGPLSAIGFLALAWALVALGSWFVTRLVRSGAGTLLEAVRSSETATALMGVDPAVVKRQAFVLSGVLAAVAGGLYASFEGYIDPTVFTFALSINFVLMAVIGGLRSVYGAVLGAAAVEAINQILSFAGTNLDPAVSGALQLTIYGLALVVIMIFWPEGLVTGLRRRRGSAPRAVSAPAQTEGANTGEGPPQLTRGAEQP
jgi:branched-chain amino acid transport system permease protein